MSQEKKAHRPRVLSDDDRKKNRQEKDKNSIKIYFEPSMKQKIDKFFASKRGSKNENLIKFFNSHPEFKKFIPIDT